jgi:hypothetical protein
MGTPYVYQPEDGRTLPLTSCTGNGKSVTAE